MGDRRLIQENLFSTADTFHLVDALVDISRMLSGFRNELEVILNYGGQFSEHPYGSVTPISIEIRKNFQDTKYDLGIMFLLLGLNPEQDTGIYTTLEFLCHRRGASLEKTLISELRNRLYKFLSEVAGFEEFIAIWPELLPVFDYFYLGQSEYAELDKHVSMLFDQIEANENWRELRHYSPVFIYLYLVNIYLELEKISQYNNLSQVQPQNDLFAD